MYTYQIGNYKHKTDKELNEQELKTLVTQLQSSNVLSEEAAEQEEYSRVENLNNAELINSSRRWLTKTTGEDWTKQGDGEVIEQYYETMRDYEHNLTSSLSLAAGLRGDKYEEQDRQDLRYMMENWDRTVPFWKEESGKWAAAGDFLEALGSDVTTYAGLATGGLGTLTGQAAKQAAKQGVMQAVKAYGKQGAKWGAIEGTAIGGLHSVGNQGIRMETGQQDEFDFGNLAVGAGGGLLFGGILGGAVGGAAGGLKALRPEKVVPSGTMVDGRTTLNPKSLTKIIKEEKVEGGTLVTNPDGTQVKITSAGKNKWEVGDADGNVTTFSGTKAKLLDDLDTEAKAKVRAETAAKRKSLKEDLSPDEVNAEMLAEREAREALEAGDVISHAQELAIRNADDTRIREVRRKDFDDFHANIKTTVYARADKAGSTAEQKALAEAEINKTMKDFDINVEDFDLDDVIEKLVKNLNKGKDKGRLTNFSLAVEDEALKRAINLHKDNSSEFLPAFKQWDRLFTKNGEIATEAGRTLQMQKNRSRMTAQQQLELMEGVLKAKDGEEVRQLVKAISERPLSKATKVTKVINEYFVHNILTAGSTMAVNLVSSMMHMSYRSIEKSAGGMMRLNTRQAKEGMVELYQSWSNIGFALQNAKNAMAESKTIMSQRAFSDTLEDVSETHLGRDYKLSEGFAGMAKEGEGLLDHVANAAGNMNRLVGRRVMFGTDELVKSMAFRGHMESKFIMKNLDEGATFSDAVRKAKADTDILVKSHMDDVAAGRKLSRNKDIREAMDNAERATFQNDYKSDMFGSIGRVSATVRSKFPVLTIVVPFIRTPANLLSFVGERTPLLQVASKEIREMLNGTPAQRGTAEAALAMGTAMWAMAAGMATGGMLTGAGAQDRGRKNVAMGNDVLPHSIVHEDGSSTSIRRYDPFSRFMLTMGIVHDTFKYQDEQSQKELYAELAVGTARSLISMPSLTGVSQLFDTLGDPNTKGMATKGEAYAAKTLAAFMPYYRLYEEIYSGNENMIPEIKKIEDAINARPHALSLLTRGFHQSADVKRDAIFGQPLIKDDMILAVSGLPHHEVNGNEQEKNVLREMDRLGMSVGNLSKKSGTLGNQVLTEFDVDDVTNRSVYDLLQETVGTVKLGGKTLVEALETQMNTNMYVNSFTDPTRRTGAKEIEGQRIAALNKVISAYRQAARVQVRRILGEDHPIFDSEKLSNQLQLNRVLTGGN